MFKRFCHPSRYSFTTLLCISYLFLSLPGVSAFPKENGHLDTRSFYGDPRRNITCLGSSYDLQLPVRPDGVDPDHFTMQELCAKTIYGGAPAGQHLGGWCSRGLEVVDGKPGQQTDQLLESDGHTENPNFQFDWRWTGVSFDWSAASQAAPIAQGADVSRYSSSLYITDLLTK